VLVELISEGARLELFACYQRFRIPLFAHQGLQVTHKVRECDRVIQRFRSKGLTSLSFLRTFRVEFVLTHSYPLFFRPQSRINF